jgi:predicted dehydrogenase
MSQERPIRVGIIGAGNIARSHADGYVRAGAAAEVTAVADVDADRAAAIGARAGGGARIFEDYRELLAAGIVDAVDICLPHHLHADAIVAAAEAGRHILCEKPLCLTIDEATRIRQAVAASGITLMCSHNQLYMPPVAAARRAIVDGLVGRVYEARTTDSFYNDFDPSSMGWRASRATSGGGELIDTGYHPTYLLLYLVGRHPVEVTAMLGRHRLTFMEGEDSATVLVRFDDGSIGSIVTSWAYQPAGSTERFSVVGEAGSLWSDGESLFHRRRGGDTVQLVEPGEAVPTIQLAVVDFIRCLRQRARPINTEVEGIEVLKVILGAYAAAEEKKVVSLPERFGD